MTTNTISRRDALKGLAATTLVVACDPITIISGIIVGIELGQVLYKTGENLIGWWRARHNSSIKLEVIWELRVLEGTQFDDNGDEQAILGDLIDTITQVIELIAGEEQDDLPIPDFPLDLDGTFVLVLRVGQDILDWSDRITVE